jgi:Zn-dependent protease with chaperone function
VDLKDFDALIRRLEISARRSPRLYRARVALLAALGYGYIAGILALLVVIVVALGLLATKPGGGAIAAKLMVPAVVIGWAVIRSLWLRIPDASGIVLTADRVPQLFAAIERVRATLDGPRFRRVLLYGEFNAGVTQRPRWGIIGPNVNDLLVGLPLLQALSPGEFEAVLAHEMGHVSRQHGRFGHWIYRVRSTWSRLAALASADNVKLLHLVLGRFLKWYAPFFNAYSFVLARQDEYEADRAAVRVAGRDAVASALVRIQVAGRFFNEHHWEAVSRDLRQGIDVTAPQAAFVPALTEGIDQADADRWLEEALRRPTDHADTHPALGDRLRAIGAGPRPSVPQAPDSSAAAVLLGSAAAALTAELDGVWWTHVGPQVAAARAAREEAARRLAELEGAASSIESAWERVVLLERLDRTAEARTAAETLLAEHPEHAPTLFFLGRVRLAADDPEGIALLERAGTLDRAAAAPAQALIFDYHWRHGRRDQAEQARAAMSDASDRAERADKERRTVTGKIGFMPQDLPAEMIQRWRKLLAEMPDLRALYIVRRVVVEMPEVPCYLVAVVPNVRWWRFRSDKASSKLLERVMAAAEWPPSTFFILGDGVHRRVVRRMRKMPGATVIPFRSEVPGPSIRVLWPASW